MMIGKYSIRDWRAVKRALAKGASVRDAAEKTGVSHATVGRWSHMDTPPDWMWLNMDINVESAFEALEGIPFEGSLAYEHRVIIYALRQLGKTHKQIAETIGCSRPTISKELARLKPAEYDPRLAQMDAEEKAKRPKERKLDANPDLRAYVANGLTLRWSPEEISRRIVQDFPDDKEMRVCHETIYQALYLQGYGTLRHEIGVEMALRSKRKGRKPQSKLPVKGKPWIEGANISLRPAEAEDRAIPGHWEGDLIIGGDMRSCLITLVERRSRFLLMSRLTVHDSETVVDRMIEMVRGIPEEFAKTLTWDQGVEMAQVSKFKLATDFEVYFCDPHSPWQRPTNENTNGLIREFFPKGTRFTKVTDEEVARAQWLLNNRPRKVLGWKFPSEVMQEVLAEGAMID